MFRLLCHLVDNLKSFLLIPKLFPYLCYFKVIHVEVEGTLQRFKKDDLEKTGFESK